MLLARGIDVSDHLGTAFGIPPPRSRRDASAAIPPGSLHARWPAPGAHGALAPGGVARRRSTADSKAVAHQGHRHSLPTVSPPPSAALRAQPLIYLPCSCPSLGTFPPALFLCTRWLTLRLLATKNFTIAGPGQPVDENDTSV
jgi:hypothetical protein